MNESAKQVAASDIARIFKSQISPPISGGWGDAKGKS